MKRTILTVILTFFLTLTSALTYAGVIGKITAIQGDVDVLMPGMERAAPAVLQQPVSEGDIIRTKSNGKAEITFVDDSVIRLAPGSRLQITEYLMEGSKRKSGVMNLFRGKIRAVVSKSRGFLGVAFGGGDRFEVRTPTAVAGVKGTDFFVSYSMGVTSITVKDGKVDAFNPAVPGQVVTVSAGNATFIAGDNPPSPPRPAADVEVIRHTQDTDAGEKPKDKKDDETATGQTTADIGGTFGYEAPGETPPPPTDTGGTVETVEIPSSESHTDLLSDTTPPVISIAGPSPYTNSSTASFAVTFDEPVTVTYTMGSWGATTTATTSDTFSIASLPEGSWTLTVIATDAAGNITTTTYSWLTDYTAPALSGLPASLTNVSSASFGVTDANPVTYTLDGTAVSSTSFPVSEGAHTFTVTDAAGNSSSYSWMTDYGAPVVTYAASPTGIITFGSDATAVYSYDIDGVILTNQTSIFFGIADGSHVLSYTATDPAGNVTTGTVSFDLSNSTITGLASGTGSILTGTSTGAVTGVYGQNWGGWTANINGSYTGPSGASWQLVSGGTGYDSLDNQNGYWIDKTTGAYSGNIMTGTSNLTYLTYTTLGTGVGTISGSYDSTLGVFSLTEAGAYTETPLAWSGQIDYDYNDNGLYNNGDGISGVGDTYGGLVGGTTSPWSGTTSLTLMGPYNDFDYDSVPYLWSAPTYDGGAFWGLTGGVWKQDRTIEASVYSLYIDPSGNAGILKGSLTGAYYPELDMFEATGTWTPTVLATGFNDPTILGSLTYDYDLTWGTSGLAGTGSFAAGGTISEGQTEGLRYSMPGTAPGEGWGVWQALTAGDYTDNTSDTWNFSFEYIDYLYTNIIGTMTEGTQWSNDVLKGTTLGYGADITSTPMTWITVGETLGTFDATAFTWQAVQTGAWIDTNKFLAMAAAGDPTGALAQLNIPFAEVGRANLIGNGNNMVVNMNDVTFFAYQTGAAPKIWATGDVNGTYTAPPALNTPVALAGNGLSANFNVQTFDTTTSGKWMATVDGSGTLSGGTYNGPTTFNGAAAGTNTIGTSGSFSGTAAGTAK